METKVQYERIVDSCGQEPVVQVDPPAVGKGCEPGRHCASHGDGPFFCCLCGASFMPAETAP